MIGEVYYVPRPDTWGGNPNDGAKHDEAESTLDPDEGGTYLYMEIGKGKIHQFGIPQSGYNE
jgi:hypothetical protein